MPVWDCPLSRRTRSSGHSLRPRITGLVWGCPSVDRSLSRMVAACGPPVPPGGVQLFSSLCPPPSRRTHNLPKRSHAVANPCSLYGLSHTVIRRESTPFVRQTSTAWTESSPVLVLTFCEDEVTTPCKTRSEKHPNLQAPLRKMRLL